MQINRYLRTIEYGIIEGSKHLWDCYGKDAWSISSANTQAVFDRNTGMVYEVSMSIEEEGLHFRWIDPDFTKKYVKESKSKGFDPWQAYDDVKYTQIKDEQGMFEILIAKAA